MGMEFFVVGAGVALLGGTASRARRIAGDVVHVVGGVGRECECVFVIVSSSVLFIHQFLISLAGPNV